MQRHDGAHTTDGAFSTLSLSIFSSQSPALHAIQRVHVTHAQQPDVEMPQHYVCFAYDAMPILLPAIRNQRQRLGMSLLQTICNLLKAVPRVCGWEPTARQPPVELEDLKGQPKLLVHMLKEFAKRKTSCNSSVPTWETSAMLPRWPLCLTSSTLGCAQWVCHPTRVQMGFTRRYRDVCARHARARHGAIFTNIYKNNLWGTEGSGSGSGSTEAAASGASRTVCVLMAFHLNAMIDAPWRMAANASAQPSRA